MKAAQLATRVSVDEVSSAVEVITTDFARELLANMGHNRKPIATSVESMAREIRIGAWHLNGEAIVIDRDGRLLDGQHRCMAVVKAGRPIRSVVVRGVDPATFTTIDTGNSRKAKDVLSIAREPNANTLAAAARSMVFIKSGSRAFAQKVTPQEVLAILEEHPSLRYWTSRYVSTPGIRETVPSSFVTVLTLMSERFGDNKAADFLRDVSTGANLHPHHPALALRNRRLKQHDSRDVCLALSIKCALAYVRGKSIVALRWTKAEPFPSFD